MRYFEEHFGNTAELVEFANLKLAEGIYLISHSSNDYGVDGIFLDNEYSLEVENTSIPSMILLGHNTIEHIKEPEFGFLK